MSQPERIAAGAGAGAARAPTGAREQLRIAVRRRGERLRVTCSGELAAASASRLLDEIPRAGTSTLVVDLRRLSFADASVLGALDALARRCLGDGVRLELLPGGVVGSLMRLEESSRRDGRRRLAPVERAGEAVQERPLLRLQGRSGLAGQELLDATEGLRELADAVEHGGTDAPSTLAPLLLSLEEALEAELLLFETPRGPLP